MCFSKGGCRYILSSMIHAFFCRKMQQDILTILGWYLQCTMLPPVLLCLRSSDLEEFSENDEEDMDDALVTNSPEPPEPVEPDDTMQTDENSQPGRLHPEQDMPHIFKVCASQFIHSAQSFLHSSLVLLISGLCLTCWCTLTCIVMWMLYTPIIAHFPLHV